MEIIDKFELVCADITDEKFELKEKVDCVVLSYTLSAFVSQQETINQIIKQAKKCIKSDGYVIIMDFAWVNMPKDDFWGGMYTKMVNDVPPNQFEIFNFFIDSAPEHAFEIFNIPPHLIFTGAVEAGFE